MNKIQNNFNRFASSYDTYAIVQKEIAKRLSTRLQAINPCVEKTLELGAGTGLLSKLLSQQTIVTDFAKNSLVINNCNNKICLNSHYLPFKKNSFDTIISNLMLQWCNFEQVTSESLEVLKKNGLYIFSTFGSLTLTELKQSWKKVDNNTHISSFNDMHNIGDSMLKIGFNGVVMESEIITLTYETVFDLLKDLKNIGAQNINAKSTSKSKLKQMMLEYEKFRKDGKLVASYEVIYGHGWKKK